jgi:hypothetical protein
MKSFKAFFYESSIDFPKDKPSPDLWQMEKDGKGYTLKSGIKDKIFSFLAKYPTFPIIETADGIRFVGSNTSTQYEDDSDIDVHLTISKLPDGKTFEEWQKDIGDWFKNNREEQDGFIEKHPIEVYLQDNFFQDLASIGVYDLKDDKWILDPMNPAKDFNPYDFFKDIEEDVRKYAKEADIDIGELKRDLIDYKTIKLAIDNISAENKQKLKAQLESKHEEIQKDVDDLLKFKLKMRDMRRSLSMPKNEDEAAEKRTDKEWLNINAIFKFIAKYGYLQLISDVEKSIGEDKKVSDKEIGQLQQVVK